MPILRMKRIPREMLQANPEWLFVFGDNVLRTGFGGQAAAMRGEPNAIGIPTKWKPTMDEDAFFTDDSACFAAVIPDLRRALDAVLDGRTVVFPEAGIGTGLAQLPVRAPMLHAFITGAVSIVERHAARQQHRESVH